MLTRSSPLVDSLSSRGSPGAWIVTDLSPRLPSRLLERCRSRRSLQPEVGETEQKVKRGVLKVFSGDPYPAHPPPPQHTPPLYQPGPPHHSAGHTCAFWSCGNGPTCKSSPSTGTRCPWRLNAVPCSAPGSQAGASWGAPQPPPLAQASSGQEAPLGSQLSP